MFIGRKYIFVVASICLSVAPALSFDGDYNYSYNYNQQYQPRQPSYPSQYDERKPSRQQYSYGGPQYGFGTRGDYTAPPGVPSDSSSVAPSRGDPDERPHRRRRHRWATPDGDDTTPLRPKRHRWSSRENDGGDQPRRRIRHQYGSGLPAASGTAGVPGYGSDLVCVRSCDGSFFPVGQALSPNLDAQDSLCKALCPDAETELYLLPPGADGIATAVSRQGRPYSKMPHALLYARKRIEACTCHGRTGQARLVSTLKDFTMRRGDAVMTANGLQIFLGTHRWPYRAADFQVLDKAKYMLTNGIALAELEKATKHLQGNIPRAKAGKADDDGDDGSADDEEPTFVTGLNGKKVRLIGDLKTFATKVSPTATPPVAARDTRPILAPTITPPGDPTKTGGIVPLWQAGNTVH